MSCIVLLWHDNVYSLSISIIKFLFACVPQWSKKWCISMLLHLGHENFFYNKKSQKVGTISPEECVHVYAHIYAARQRPILHMNFSSNKIIKINFKYLFPLLPWFGTTTGTVSIFKKTWNKCSNKRPHSLCQNTCSTAYLCFNLPWSASSNLCV